jgi:putative addiction module killer protein
VIELREYVDVSGKNTFERWFLRQTDDVQLRVTVYLKRLANGNFSVAKSLGAGLYELRLDFGPGYRVYYGMDGETLVILLGGGSKQRQDVDIKAAHGLWLEYKRNK